MVFVKIIDAVYFVLDNIRFGLEAVFKKLGLIEEDWIMKYMYNKFNIKQKKSKSSELLDAVAGGLLLIAGFAGFVFAMFIVKELFEGVVRWVKILKQIIKLI